MAPSPRSRRTLALLAVVVVLAGVAGAVVWTRADDGPPPVRTRDVRIDVADGPGRDQPVQLDATLHLPQRTPAPAVLVAHGFGGDKDAVAADARELAERGFVALAYSARGFGRSTGQIALNSPDYEVADAQQLLDWLSRQPEVTTDAPGDPRVGVTGGSYGGALALLLAGVDPRVDAIAPVITYNDLGQALLPNAGTTGKITPRTPAAGAFSADGVFKRNWAGLFFAAGLGPGGGATPKGQAPEPGAAPTPSPTQGGQLDQGSRPDRGEAPRTGQPVPQQGPATCGRFRPEVCQAYVEVTTTGRASAATVELLRRSSPASVTERIKAPTLLVQGEQDTLFGLDQSDATARQIAAGGGTVKTVWYSGGHDGGNPGPSVRGQIADWFAFHLKHTGPDPGTGFEYAVQGAFRSGGPTVRVAVADRYPGLDGPDDQGVERRPVALRGPAQVVLNPPGGNPASLSSLPGLGSRLSGAGSGAAALAGGLAADVPGQTAVFTSEPVDAQVLVTGSSRVRLRVSSVPGQPATGEAVLFVKLYDVGPDGRRTLPGNAVAPVRVGGLPADGTPVEVSVTLPGVVRPVEAGHRLQLAVTTTDQGYAGPTAPAVHRIELAGDGQLSVPTVPGRRAATGGTPALPLLGVGIVLAVVALVALGVAVRRRHLDDVHEELADVPLVIRDLSKSYRGGLKAVDGLSFRVERGQVLGLLGPNGAGKTTTLRMLMGLVRPSTGEIRVFGHRVLPGVPVLSRIGAFVERTGFLPHLSGLDNLRLHWAATGRPAEQAHAEEALEIAGLGKAVHRRVGTYSQGMRQRLAIAQAMLGLPDLLVLDEPTNGLDPPQIHHMREVLRRYAATGRTVVVSSHLLAEVEQTCTHVVVMHHGRLVAVGEVGEIVDGGEVAFRVDDVELAADALRGLPGVGAVTPDGQVVHADLGVLPRSAAVAALVAAGVAVDQVGPRRRLEDAFLQLVGEEAVE
ncbi:alpha/beta fold hydrolase [Streptoalloteichus tenebrarius]|uniref:alpha/beta fold hydrolase n=1 Tax=Streptoalloteichus tenebrarius (strain ATCC 17920 / DSM 40477 / JCM 4838 / CBS 697.72 / NBRC 16177 / NCIMB 11028 / NRRL B-12390 / A12253. 1 / ISP 5477) TaxID=1933 RepID=UPI0020A2DE65|nr:alpha/beta fold hydrolase [Streptoalloteichus tenebrarius]BFF03607.1 alpha/beta fold hydrolase [Streptoalloteichus tenebrarius]